MKAVSLVLGLSGMLILTGCKGREVATPAPEAASALVGQVSPEAVTGDEAVDEGLLAPADPDVILGEDGEALRSGEIEPRFPQAYTRWGQAVDRLGADLVYWVRSLDGHQNRLTWVNVGGRPLIKGYVCEMHRCGMNEVVYLMRPDQSRIIGIAKLDEDRPERTEYLIGEPTLEEARCLRFYLANEYEEGSC